MAKIYTKTGDKGMTGLIGGKRVSKGDLRLEAYGTIDEFNSVIGYALSSIPAKARYAKEFKSVLSKMQNELFQVGSLLACVNDEWSKKLTHISEEQIQFYEKKIDVYTKELPELKNFILPGGTELATRLHWARTVCRRAERIIVRLSEQEKVEDLLVQYINRLSDFCFVLARFANFKAKTKEIIWKA